MTTAATAESFTSHPGHEETGQTFKEHLAVLGTRLAFPKISVLKSVYFEQISGQL